MAKDYRASHISLEKSRRYEEEIYRHGSYDDMLWRAEQSILLRETRTLRQKIGIVSYLDFGCGTGRILQLLEPEVDIALGVDISESMIAIARSKGIRASMIVGDITREDIIGDKTFQLITAFRVFLNAGAALSGQMCDVLIPKLDPKGVFIFNMHGNIWSHRVFTKIWFKLHGRQLNTSSYGQVKKMIAPYNLKIVRSYGLGVMPKIFYRIFGARFMYAVDLYCARIPFLKFISYNLIFICAKTPAQGLIDDFSPIR